MKPLTLEETALKEEMKERCLAKGQYIDENAKAKFDMLCHLEDFEIQYWKLQQENKQLKERINKALNKIDNMFDRGDTNTIIDDLLELDKIFKGSDSSE